MNKHITRTATVVLLLFGALFVNLNLIALVQADDLATHSANRRVIIREYEIERGPIVAGEEAIARSVESDGELRFLRTYRDGELYAHLTGYYSFLYQRSGLEDALNEDLTGRPTEVVAQNLGELIFGRDRPGNAVQLTIHPGAQQAARDALGGREGAVVALDPRTGAVLASYANPTYDPNPVSSHSASESRQAMEALLDDDASPLLDRTRQELYPPGSAFKIVVAAAALESGMQPDAALPNEAVYDVPQTTANIRNFGGGLCGDGGDTISLADSFRVSCNTSFARLGVDLGIDALAAQAEEFGFNRRVPYELGVVPSAIPLEMDVPSTAQSAIGQRDVRVTPMQMALIAASIANNGEMMRPYLVEAVRDPSSRLLRGPDIEPWTETGFDGRPVSSRTAEELRRMMVAAVERGTGSAARIDGVEVGGKTGTAQTGDTPTAWFVGFAGSEVAVAVVVPAAGADATGGRIAAPIARDVMLAIVGG